jgi:hypothetical protein
MPQPALHLLIAESALTHWRSQPRRAPFDCTDEISVNAFRHGCLAPDYGLFPGGDNHLSAIAHRGRTGALLRAVHGAASTMAQRAFAWGWLTHTLADVAIHPLINDAARSFTAESVPAGTGQLTIGEGGRQLLADHVRVEVGIDVWFTWQHPVLCELRLTPAFGRGDYAFVSNALLGTHGYAVTPAQLVRMQRGMIHFTHAALHFATSLARDVCWDRTNEAASRYVASTMLWRVLSTAASRRSLVHAYLNPVRPEPALIRQVDTALAELIPVVDAQIATGLRDLPDYNLETGTITIGPARSVA